MTLLLLFGEHNGTPIERIAVTLEQAPDKLAWRIDPPSGAASRWAADEPLAENVIDEIRLVGEMPGGYKEATGVLARDPRTSWPDLSAYSDISVYQPGVEEVWAGRLDKAPESEGDHMSIEPAAVGWQAALEDDKSMIGPGFIDSDLSKWGEPTTARRLYQLENSIYIKASTSLGTSSLDTGAIEPAIVNDFSNVSDEAGRTESGEADYDGGGVDIGRVLYDYRVLAVPDSAFESNVALGTTDTFVYFAVGENHAGTTSAPQREVAATGPGYKFARVRDRYAGSWGNQMTNVFAWLRLKVLGTHGLTPQGTWPNIGFTAKQMLEYAIPRYTALEASAESLEDDGFVIPQAWFSDPGDMATVVKELTKYGLLDWFVFGDRLFQLRFPGSYGRKWQAYVGPSELTEAGLDASRLWRSIVVRYQDVDGTARTVGPPGSSATVETEALEVTDPDHPAVKADLTRKDVLDLGTIGTAASAIATGERWLEEANLLSRSGSCNLTGYVLDDHGIPRPAAQVKPGDFVRFPDASDRSYRKITRVDYAHSQRQASCSLDGPPEGLAALLERYQAALTPLGLR
jgi:hypothetical protein